MIFFTADHHFGHENIIKYCERSFANAREMDQFMIDAWNEVVGPNDLVYHLGDFTLKGSLSPWIHALNFGHMRIIPGGHDQVWLERDRSQRNVEVWTRLETIEIPSGKKYPYVIVMCHYPMLSWDRSNHGSLHLHGHSHGRIPSEGKRIDVGVDAQDFRPVSLDSLLEVY